VGRLRFNPQLTRITQIHKQWDLTAEAEICGICVICGRLSSVRPTNPVKKQILIYGLIYGLCGGLLIAALKLIEYRFVVLEHSIEIYGGLIALLFAALGIWLGLKVTRKEQVIVERELIVEREVMVPAGGPFALNERQLQELGITKRELEILGLIAQGFSNREIGEKLFVSENTVKTHSSRLFDKLSARRRTQAVQRGKELGLIP
jgi:NarL family two-component system response regulator LiaR